MKFLSIAFLPLLMVLSGSTFLAQNALASQSLSLGSAIENFTESLNDQIREQVTDTMQKANNSLGSTTIINGTDTNATNIVSSRSVVSNNNSLSTTAGGNASGVSSQVTNINGVCTSNITGGAGSEMLSSKGNCNDQLTGGSGADTFVCGEGNDLVRDYNSTEGDRLEDEENCETIQ
jgi:hypothetical protein